MMLGWWGTCQTWRGDNKHLGLVLNSKAKDRMDTLDFGTHQQELHFIPGWQQVFQSLFILFPAWLWGCLLQWKPGLPKPFSPGFLTSNCPLQLPESCSAKELCTRRG